ncbi:GNAT family N-acetyltransferase [Hyphomonas sp.]|uniref:GNAT family N-acetyltransferase n=1 Tax=Hyphomonas sp. TaxID=87 RepID=UPI0032ED1248
MYKHAGAGWSIRPFTLNDRISCLRIFSDCLRDFPWRGDWKAYLPVLQNAFVSSRVLVAEEPSAGMIAFLTVQMRTGYVDHLFVDEDWRLCGVGRGLLEVARNEAARPLILDVDMQNVAARRAYEKLGWHVVVDAKPLRPGQQVRLVSP